MGRDVDAGQHLLVASPGGTAKAIVLHPDADYLLVGSVLSPAWSPQRTRIGAGQPFIDKYAGSADWATPEFLQALIGPNFGAAVGATGAPLQITIDASGQFVWQDMQLSERQLRVEMRRFKEDHAEQALVVKIQTGAPTERRMRVEAIAAEEGVNVQYNKTE